MRWFFRVFQKNEKSEGGNGPKKAFRGDYVMHTITTPWQTGYKIIQVSVQKVIYYMILCPILSYGSKTICYINIYTRATLKGEKHHLKKWWVQWKVGK